MPFLKRTPRVVAEKNPEPIIKIRGNKKQKRLYNLWHELGNENYSKLKEEFGNSNKAVLRLLESSSTARIKDLSQIENGFELASRMIYAAGSISLVGEFLQHAGAKRFAGKACP